MMAVQKAPRTPRSACSTVQKAARESPSAAHPSRAPGSGSLHLPDAGEDDAEDGGGDDGEGVGGEGVGGRGVGADETPEGSKAAASPP